VLVEARGREQSDYVDLQKTHVIAIGWTMYVLIIKFDRKQQGRDMSTKAALDVQSARRRGARNRAL